MNLENLNNEQKEAVLYNEGPLLILAGAGSGKTRVLTTKVAYLIEELDVDPANILAITFTNKAAKEMKQRVNKLIGPASYRAQISTFHSFGLRIVKEYPELVGLEKNFTILDADDVLTFVKKKLKDMNLDPAKFNPRAIKAKISSAKNEFILPEEYTGFSKIDFDKIVAKIYTAYEEQLKINNSVDFDDLLTLPIKIFKEYPNILTRFQEEFEYILIDEYQDTNHVQYILAKMISAKHSNITVVGDADQSIYSFRGSNYKNILNFEKDYANAKVIKLEQNYRSTQVILDAANNVIKNNKERKDKKLWSDNNAGEKITYRRAYDGKDEAHYVTGEIRKLVNDKYTLNDMVVLYRTNAQSREMEDELRKENIPYKMIGGFSFYKRAEVKDLLAYLKLIYNTLDDVSLLRTINTPRRGIGNKSVSNIIEKANRDKTCLFDAIEEGKELLFKELILELREASKTLSLTELIEMVIEKSGMRKFYLTKKTMENTIKLENILELKSKSFEIEEKTGSVDLGDFLDDISLMSDVEEEGVETSNITLMTIHGVKGLEFDVVFLVGAEEGILPHINSMNSESDIEEERRLCYVAITRAREKLYILNTKRRMLFGREQANPPSRFISEIGADSIESVNINDTTFEKKVSKNEMFHKEDIDYSYGDKVEHTTYGSGIVVAIDGQFLDVAFEHGIGIKKLLKNHKSINKA